MALLICIVATLVFFGACIVLSRPAEARYQAPAILIVAAHSDDCVIMGAEIAWGILRQGGKARIAYLTCSGPDKDSDMSRVRAKEARAAWDLFESSDVTFLDLGLPESPVDGPASYRDEEIVAASHKLSRSLNELPEGSIMLVPASHESHVDHRNARRLALLAHEILDRPDIRIIETTEYNDVLSMRQNPVKVCRLILAQFPLVGRRIRQRAQAPGFHLGPPGSMFRDTPERLQMKTRMLRSFASQDPELLLRYFSWPSRYRSFRETDRSTGFKILGGVGDFSVLIFVSLLTLNSMLFGEFLLSMNAISGSYLALSCIAALGFLLIVFSIAKRRSVLAILTSGFCVGFPIGVIA